MQTSFRFLAPPEPCSYLPDRTARLEYAFASDMTAGEYAELMLSGWRRFGHALFRPQCPHCTACISLRVDVARFRPSRSQRRVRKANEGRVSLAIGKPQVSDSRLELYRKFHAHRSASRGWSERENDAASYYSSFVDNPFPTEEWAYSMDGALVGLGLVDRLPVGLSAIYFVHDPGHACHGLGVWNILCLIEQARRCSLPHLYLGYWVADCISLAYKASFRPYELLGADGCWREQDPARHIVAGEDPRPA